MIGLGSDKNVDFVLVMPYHDKPDNWITRPVTKLLLQMCGFKVTKLPNPSSTFYRKVCVTHPVELCNGWNESG